MDTKKSRIKNSVFFRLNIFTVLTLVILVVLTISATKRIVRPQLESRFHRMASQVGNTILAELSIEIYKAKTLSNILAQWAETMKLDTRLYKRTLPVLIDLKAGENFIAGGGLWPEPYAFTKRLERRSFFWGRRKEGFLEYFNDYNIPASKGYHNEEWYVPVRFLPRNTVYWSQVYTAPYTHQPVMTCSTPVYRENKFFGVATIDIKLDGLRDSIQKIVTKSQGYGFILDRFNQVIFYSHKLNSPKKEVPYSYTNILKVGNSYDSVMKTVVGLDVTADKLSANHRILVSTNKAYFSKNINNLSNKKIELLSLDMANKILFDENLIKQHNRLVKQVEVESDPVLDGGSTAFIFHMPETNWKLILFLPHRPTEVAVSEIIKDISWFQSIVIILMFLSGSWLMAVLVARPVKQMIQQLKNRAHEKDDAPNLLTVTGKGEIEELVSSFNEKTVTLSNVLSEVRKLEEEKSKRLLEFIQSINDAIITINSDGNVIFWNKAAHKIFGYTFDDILYKNITCIIPESLHAPHHAGLNKAVQTGKIKNADTILELPAITKKGEHLLVELTLSASFADGARVFTAILRDITERKKHEEEIEKANKSKSEFLSNMSHELRTPMHAILSYSSFGMNRIDKATRDKLFKYFEQISISGKRLLNLLNDLLDMSKLEAGKMVLTIENKEILSLVEGCVEEVRLLAEERSIDIMIHNNTQYTYLEMDVARINQVFINLLSNAIKFTDKGGKIKIVLADSEVNTDNAVLLSVEDQGPGIPENELEAIFDKFIQSSQTNTGAGGTGLGLAICQEIIQIHHGEIWAENSQGGAVFYILLPLEYYDN